MLICKVCSLGLSYLGKGYRKPQAERFASGYWYVQALGWSFWCDDSRPETVGERGAW